MGLDRAMRQRARSHQRHEVQVLRRAGHSQTEVSRLTGVSLSEIRRIEAEEPVESYDDAAERRRRGIGRPSKAEPFRAFVVEQLARDPKVTSLDLLQGAKVAGYAGSKSAFYALVARLRPEVTHAIGSVGELPGDESKHGFGDVEVRFAESGLQRIHFFVSQLSYSRWSEVTAGPRPRDGIAAPVARPALCAHRRGAARRSLRSPQRRGDRGQRRRRDGPWHPAFAQTILDLGIGVDLRGRGRDERSGGPVERLVRWVKTSFFAARRFATAGELEARLREWRHHVNTRATARGTGAVPQARMAEERVRLRPLALRVDDFAPRIPVLVGPGPEVVYEGVAYPMPAESVGKRAMLYLHLLDESASSAPASISNTNAGGLLGGQSFRNDTWRHRNARSCSGIQSAPASGGGWHIWTESPSDDVVAKQKIPETRRSRRRYCNPQSTARRRRQSRCTHWEGPGCFRRRLRARRNRWSAGTPSCTTGRCKSARDCTLRPAGRRGRRSRARCRLGTSSRRTT